MNLPRQQFDAIGNIVCLQEVAPCHLFTMEQYQLVRAIGSENAMTYRLQPDRKAHVQMIGFRKGARFRTVDLLREECSLAGLADLLSGTVADLVQWCSRWGLLGFRCQNRGDPTIDQCLQEHAALSIYPDTYAEPLELVKEAVRIAGAATALYTALREEDGTKRVLALRALISPGLVEYPLGPGTPDFWFRDDTVMGVSIGVSDEAFPNAPTDWTRRAVEGLQHLTHQYFSQNLVLDFTTHDIARRPTQFRWAIKSLFGVLFLKMLQSWRTTRYCTVCRRRIDHRRSQAKTCSDYCRKQRSLQRKGKEAKR